MEQFKKALAVAIDAMADLEREFERMDADHSDDLSRGYPFGQDLSELVRLIMEWRESIEGR